MPESKTEGSPAAGNAAGFDPTNGFVVINNTGWNIYLQTPGTTRTSGKPTNLTNPFEKISYPLGQASSAQTTPGSYPVRVDDSTSAPILITVDVDPDTGSVRISSGTRRGSVAVGAYFA